MTDPLTTAASWVDEPRYEITGEFDVERGYVFTSCASVENGNPLFWDDQVAAESILTLVISPMNTRNLNRTFFISRTATQPSRGYLSVE